MLTFCRPHGTAVERHFIAKFIAPLPGVWQDEHLNYHVQIGESPILWSSHTDTVHKVQGYQSIRVDHLNQSIHLSRRSKRIGVRCLGADDTVGCFLMCEMIRREVPGHYIFHYGEEVGGIGSGELRDRSPHLIQSALFAIALDRQGTGDIVTSQTCGDCASTAFVASLAPMLPGTYSAARGLFTDTANYADIIPECTNLSVGYYRAHTPDEWVDYSHVAALLEALCILDASRLVCARDPYAPKPLAHYGRFDSLAGDFDHLTSRTFSSERLFDSPRDYCADCDAPIIDIDSDDPDEVHLYLTGDYCKCDLELEHLGLTKDDRLFLEYLRNR